MQCRISNQFSKWPRNNNSANFLQVFFISLETTYVYCFLANNLLGFQCIVVITNTKLFAYHEFSTVKWNFGKTLQPFCSHYWEYSLSQCYSVKWLTRWNERIVKNIRFAFSLPKTSFFLANAKYLLRYIAGIQLNSASSFLKRERSISLPRNYNNYESWTFCQKFLNQSFHIINIKQFKLYIDISVFDRIRDLMSFADSEFSSIYSEMSF